METLNLTTANLTEAQIYYVEKVRDPKDKQVLISIFEKDNLFVKEMQKKFGIK
jgi:hypothetical protein